MTLKYLAVLGHEQVNQVHGALHVPIDSVVFDEAKKIGVTRSQQRAWSKLTKEEYVDYQQALQKSVAERFGEDYPPLGWETKAWATRGRRVGVGRRESLYSQARHMGSLRVGLRLEVPNDFENLPGVTQD